MEYNAYAPPSAVVAELPAETAARDFHVVGKTKFIALYLLTFGLYHIVWMYQQWAQFKRQRRADMWPVARGIFPIFFTHSLTSEIDRELKRADIRHTWSPSGLATGIVVLMIGTNLFNRVPDEVVGLVGSMAVIVPCLFLLAWLTWQVQYAANLACADAKGEENRRFGWANWLWAIVGGLWWALAALGVIATMMGVE